MDTSYLGLKWDFLTENSMKSNLGKGKMLERWLWKSEAGLPMQFREWAEWTVPFQIAGGGGCQF